MFHVKQGRPSVTDRASDQRIKPTKVFCESTRIEHLPEECSLDVGDEYESRKDILTPRSC